MCRAPFTTILMVRGMGLRAAAVVAANARRVNSFFFNEVADGLTSSPATGYELPNSCPFSVSAMSRSWADTPSFPVRQTADCDASSPQGAHDQRIRAGVAPHPARWNTCVPGTAMQYWTGQLSDSDGLLLSGYIGSQS